VSPDHRAREGNAGGEEADGERCGAAGHESSLLQAEDQEGRRRRAESADGLTAPRRLNAQGGTIRSIPFLSITVEVAGLQGDFGLGRPGTERLDPDAYPVLGLPARSHSENPQGDR
jgi:hypothetical protein